MNTLVIAILLVGLALILLGIDLFLPTGGILMLLSAIFAVVGTGFGFAHSLTAGGWLTLVVLLAIPTSLAIFVKFYPSTPIGRQMIINRPQAVAYDYTSGKERHRLTVGDVGLATSLLQPAGTITIHGQDFEAVSVTGVIERGSAVIVTDIEMNVATVEKYESSNAVGTNLESVLEPEQPPKSSNLLDLSPEDFNLKNFDSTKDA